jgi:hypothetical protein
VAVLEAAHRGFNKAVKDVRGLHSGVKIAGQNKPPAEVQYSGRAIAE